MAKVININHVGIVVPNIKKTLTFWQDILGINLDYREEVPTMNLELAWLPVGKSRIEFLTPTSEEGNEYYEYLKSKGPGFHHICLEVDNIDEMLNILKQNNIRLKDEIAVELPGRKLAFLDPEDTDGVIVELYELT